jgi:hypothetical protein
MAPRYRTTIDLGIDPPVVAVGDHTDKKRSVHLASLSVVYQLHDLGIVSFRSSITSHPLEIFISLFHQARRF